jgi:hypothetical protein
MLETTLHFDYGGGCPGGDEMESLVGQGLLSTSRESGGQTCKLERERKKKVNSGKSQKPGHLSKIRQRQESTSVHKTATPDGAPITSVIPSPSGGCVS